MEKILNALHRIQSNVERVIVGKPEQIKLTLCCWLSGGHVLLEDFPGTGKTMLARAIAKSASVDFKRVQFTPDLLPSDITGSSVFNQGTSQFEFYEGPLFSTVFLGDELNRATPRTQSALLEAMGEGQITVDGVSRKLNSLFFVMATQNPIEQYGTFPLPEAQLDRFIMRLSMGYPTFEEEISMVRNQNRVHPIHELKPVLSEENIRAIREVVPSVEMTDNLYRYVMQIITATRKCPDFKMGASPRATISLIRAAQAKALFEGLTYVNPTLLYDLVVPVLAHRLLLTSEAKLEGKKSSDVLEDLLRTISVPVK